MKTFIALFRGINIGGHNLLPMKELTTILQDLGATGVTTWGHGSGLAMTHSNRCVTIVANA